MQYYDNNTNANSTTNRNNITSTVNTSTFNLPSMPRLSPSPFTLPYATDSSHDTVHSTSITSTNTTSTNAYAKPSSNKSSYNYATFPSPKYNSSRLLQSQIYHATNGLNFDNTDMNMSQGQSTRTPSFNANRQSSIRSNFSTGSTSVNTNQVDPLNEHPHLRMINELLNSQSTLNYGLTLDQVAALREFNNKQRRTHQQYAQ